MWFPLLARVLDMLSRNTGCLKELPAVPLLSNRCAVGALKTDPPLRSQVKFEKKTQNWNGSPCSLSPALSVSQYRVVVNYD